MLIRTPSLARAHPQPAGVRSPTHDSPTTLAKDVSTHIFTVSATLTGVCLTVIGLIQVVAATIHVDTIADNLLAADALLFLASCLLSYWALRTRNTRRLYRVERMADAIFVAGLLLMTGVCSIIAYELM